jgi:SAM-dependent methyltransferase
MQQRDVNRRCRDAMRLTTCGRVLDIGCGTGEFLAAMRRLGWDTHGVEPNEGAAAYAREKLGLDVRADDLQNLDLPDCSFDLVTLWTVLEHLHDPGSVLRTARRILRPSGLLIISIPDIQSLDARCFGTSWVGYDTPRHLYVFSRDNIRSLLAQAGFATWDEEHSQADYYTFLGSLEPWLRARLHQRSIFRAVGRILHVPGMRMLTWPLFWAINLFDRGCIVTFYARPADSEHEPGTGECAPALD